MVDKTRGYYVLELDDDGQPHVTYPHRIMRALIDNPELIALDTLANELLDTGDAPTTDPDEADAIDFLIGSFEDGLEDLKRCKVLYFVEPMVKSYLLNENALGPIFDNDPEALNALRKNLVRLSELAEKIMTCEWPSTCAYYVLEFTSTLILTASLL